MSSTKLKVLGMEGVIANYRRGRHTVHPKQCIIIINDIKTKKEANKMIGRTVVWKSPTGKELKGVISRAHGNNGAVRALFKKAGLPGQALVPAFRNRTGPVLLQDRISTTGAVRLWRHHEQLLQYDRIPTGPPGGL